MGWSECFVNVFILREWQQQCHRSAVSRFLTQVPIAERTLDLFTAGVLAEGFEER